MDEPAESADPKDAGAADALLVAVGKRIREARLAAGMSFEDVAAAAGISRGYVYRMESGKQNATIRSLARVAVALSTSMSSLLQGVDADPSVLGTRKYVWQDGADPRDPSRPIGNRRAPTSEDQVALPPKAGR
jgi:transcriptional regulator with XRE-family HTH domain